MEPVPTASQIRFGIRHKNREWENQGIPWEPVRAIASRKMHYLTQLIGIMDAASGADSEPLAFARMYPNLQFEGHLLPLDEEGWRWYADNADIHTEKQYVKHILNAHDGEAKLVGDYEWEQFTPSGGNVLNPRFWHCQYMKHPETRKYMGWRMQQGWHAATLLNPKNEANWILRWRATRGTS